MFSYIEWYLQGQDPISVPQPGVRYLRQIYVLIDQQLGPPAIKGRVEETLDLDVSVALGSHPIIQVVSEVDNQVRPGIHPFSLHFG